MTDLTRNTRTLIVCFSLAIFVLIPLRFIEISQQVPEDYGEATVLGETQQIVEYPEVVLPSADEYIPGELESPYDDIDEGVLGIVEGDVLADCMSLQQVDEAVARVNEGLAVGLYADLDQAGAEIQWLNSQLCQ